MAWLFGDGFELYAAPADAYAGGSYWDSSAVAFTLVAGRFSGSRAIQGSVSSAVNPILLKSSGSNDTTHHLNFAIQQTTTLTGTAAGLWFTFSDGATAQCSVVFRSDGVILLTAGGAGGTTLATYTGALTASNTWYGFEIEVVVSNTAGSVIVRKNGNTSNDFASATNLDTAATANNYANRLGIGNSQAAGPQTVDDFLWRSDTASVPWVGDVRCYTRMPVSDVGVQWTPSGAVVPVTPFVQGNTGSSQINNPRYQPFTAPCDGTINIVSISLNAANPGNVKCTIFASSGTAPTTILGSAAPLTGLSAGNNTFTFGTPVAVTRGIQYWVGFAADTAVTNTWNVTTLTDVGFSSAGSISYAAFPTASPATSIASALIFTANITPTGAANAPFVADIRQDAAASYVSSSTVGQTDLYGIAPITGTPTSIIGVTTRALCQKTDAGTRNVALRLRSGATDVTGTSTALNTTWGWIFRTDTTDPATGAAWTPTGVNNLIIGETLTA